MSLSSFHMNDKQIVLAPIEGLTSAMEAVAKRYTGDTKATTDFLIEASSDISDAGAAQTGSMRFQWQGKRGAALIRILEGMSQHKLDLETLTTCESINRLNGVLRSVGAHQANGRKTIAKHARINEQLLARNMEVFAMLAYYTKLMLERGSKARKAQHAVVTELTDRFIELHALVSSGKAKPTDVKEFVTVSHMIDTIDAVKFVEAC
ncbi:hypothetical protein DXJ84_08785 [Vibrio parahaemolyticus]|uniref:hypothetical protein n=1 Tax=Vibrio parahaemolyticus TaxID=670 RepID=UPI0011207F1A|nr:hypothetical protein [Vibrio parahaemolyticus]TPA28460.1 hypothetical protein DXJ84_08785 [Vibrio parahaemolyticus]